MNKQGNILIILLIIAVLVAGIIIYFRSKPVSNPSSPQLTATSTPEQTKTFQSKSLKLSLQISDKWQITEKSTFVDLVSPTGKINISRIATNFDDISSYIKDFDAKRKLAVESESMLKIDNYPSSNRIEILKGGPVPKQKVYYIYVNGWVYSLSTTSESLFDDLDQIAQSFKYTP